MWQMQFLRSALDRLFRQKSAVEAIVATRDPSSITPDEHDLVYKKGCDLISPHMPLLHHENRAAKSSAARRSVERGIVLLKFITQANPNNLSAFWFIGKGYQALGQSATAHDAF